MLLDSPLKIKRTAQFNTSPICIGGIGGSGTRVPSSLLSNMGLFMGNNVNNAFDNLDFPNITKLLKQTDFSTFLLEELFLEFEEKMQTGFKQSEKHINWGWKVPGSFFYLEFLSKFFPDMKYIHIVRNGFDMAFSSNMNQLKNRGALFNITTTEDSLNKDALRYWIAANELAISTSEKFLADRFLLISFEDLCYKPKAMIERITDFINYNINQEVLSELSVIPSPPSTIDRHLEHDINALFGKKLIDRTNVILEKARTK